MYWIRIPTVVIFSASSSGISMSNSSSKAMTSSTVSKESAPRSSMKLGRWSDVVLLDPELLDDDLLDPLLDRLSGIRHDPPSPPHMYKPPLTWITWPVM